MSEPEAKPFLEHLDDLRWVIVKSVVALAIGVTICLVFTQELIRILEWPLRQAGQDPASMAIVLHPADPFFIQMQVGMMGGIVLALPYVLFQVAGFVLPALTLKEKSYLAPVFSAGAILFLAGLAFCYYLVLPQTFTFFVEYNAWMGVEAKWTLQNYIDFTVQMLLGMGLAFEFPLVLMILNVLGILPHQTLSEYRRHAIVAVVVIATCITPSTDPLSIAMIAAPLYALYEACIWLTLMREKRQPPQAPESLG